MRRVMFETAILLILIHCNVYALSIFLTYVVGCTVFGQGSRDDGWCECYLEIRVAGTMLTEA